MVSLRGSLLTIESIHKEKGELSILTSHIHIDHLFCSEKDLSSTPLTRHPSVEDILFLFRFHFINKYIRLNCNYGPETGLGLIILEVWVFDIGVGQEVESFLIQIFQRCRNCVELQKIR
ncbi:hypothetical protein H5410_062316 [Solanum commersonii]|uniref:Uncharacterized protein n=1 Tax=Solanum commersonii TaxID=4109 RepID=A0A9J5WCA4_SOLCO|nr:hypothetical protein H5410_062316 [Solanum commersonii]